MTSISANGATDIVYIENIGGSIIYRINNGSSNTISIWPVSITNDNPSTTLKVYFATDITINNNPTGYFICNSDFIQFGNMSLNTDGSVPTITIHNTTDYPGLIQNGTSSTDGKNDISIFNLNIFATGSTTLVQGGGWVGHRYFSRNSLRNSIVNCKSNGDISYTSGGIIGANSATPGSFLTITGCSSSGSLDNFSGGIVGSSSGSSNLTIERCFSSGDFIGNQAGGILGDNCSAVVINCYNISSVIGINGGIFGGAAGSLGNITVFNCYSTGTINGGGGIFGYTAGITGYISILNCYSTGDITNGGGGIYAMFYNSAQVFANNCYTTGSVETFSGSGGIFAGINDNTNNPGNYSEGNAGTPGWNDVNAKIYLVQTPTITRYGQGWSQPNGVNTPYILSTSGYSPYSITLTNTISQSIMASESSIAGIVSGYTYDILQINNAIPSSYPKISVNSSTGAISTTLDITLGTYTIIIYSTKNPYSITTFTLIVTQYIPPPTPSAPIQITNTQEVPCCAKESNLKNIDYDIRNHFVSGNVMVSETNPPKKYPSYDFFWYNKKMALASKR
jgi:hypothetical protein